MFVNTDLGKKLRCKFPEEQWLMAKKKGLEM
jgi:hypothetical protein